MSITPQAAFFAVGSLGFSINPLFRKVLMTGLYNKNVNPAFEKYNMKMDGEASKAMLVPLVITAVISVVLGIWPDAGASLYVLAEQAAAAVFEGGL